MWINPSQRAGGDYVQPSSFSRGGSNDWSRGGGGGRGGNNDWSRGGGGGGNNDWSRGGGGRGGGRGGNDDWSRGGGRGGGGTPQNIKSSDFSFSSQNRFSALDSNSHAEKAEQNSAEDV